jgi:hypothetical protein
MMIVKIEKHIGQMATALGVVNVDHDQYQVFAGASEADLKLVGYLPKAEGSRFMPVINLPDQLWDVIINECKSFKGGDVLPPIPIYWPEELQTEDEESDDSDK